MVSFVCMQVENFLVDCQGTAKKMFNSCTTDKKKTLATAALYNAVVAMAVSYQASITEDYNFREWKSDIVFHALNAVTCTAEVFTPDNPSVSFQSMLDTLKKITILANNARMAGIAASTFYGTNTIPTIPNVLDLLNHGLTNVVLEKQYAAGKRD